MRFKKQPSKTGNNTDLHIPKEMQNPVHLKEELTATKAKRPRYTEAELLVGFSEYMAHFDELPILLKSEIDV